MQNPYESPPEDSLASPDLGQPIKKKQLRIPVCIAAAFFLPQFIWFGFLLVDRYLARSQGGSPHYFSVSVAMIFIGLSCLSGVVWIWFLPIKTKFKIMFSVLLPSTQGLFIYIIGSRVILNL